MTPLSMAPSAATPARAMWLLARLRLRRLLNVATTAKFRVGKPKPAGEGAAPKRAATGAKSRAGWVLPVLLVLSMSFSFMQMAVQAARSMQCRLNPASHCSYVTAQHHARLDYDLAGEELLAAPFGTPVALGMTFQMSLLFAVAFLMPLGSRELAQADWDLEWLVTLPVRRSTLLWGRLLERTLANPVGWLALGPPCIVVAWYSGFRWSAPVLGLAGAFALLPAAALLRTVADTGLRMWLAPAQLRNLQAVAALLSMPFFYLAIAFGLPNGSLFVFDWARAFPQWTLWTPPGLVVAALNADGAARAFGLAGLLAAQLGTLLWAGVALLQYQLRDGVVASGVRESARKAVAPARPDGSGTGLRRLLPSSPIQRRELRLLGRDRNFLLQSILLPVIMVGSQIMINGKNLSLADLGSHATATAAIAFGIAAYMLMLSAFQTLNNEGQVLWMLYTFPRSIESVLREKAQLWSVLALVYPVILFALAAWLAPDLQLLSLFAIVLAGVPIYTTIAVALGVFACDPLAQDARAKVRPSYLYLYMSLAGLYTYALYTEVWSQKLVVMVLTGAFALALWQKARDALPYLLDPVAAPPARVSTSDGLMAALLFFVLQALALWLLVAKFAVAPGQAMVVAFAAAGALTYGLTRLIYWLSKTAGVPPLLRGAKAASTLGWGGGMGLVAAALGLAYLGLLRHSPFWAELATDNRFGALAPAWLFALAVLAAPLCEEFIFRGLIFGGLRRSLGLAPATLASAAVFAIVHPPAAMLPVFGLGLCAAYAYQRAKTLAAPMLAHALYNGLMLSYQLFS